MTRCWFWSSLIFLLISGAAIPANAQSMGTKQELVESDFDTLITLAREAFEDEEFDAAIELLLLANRQEPDPRLLLNIARSYERTGDCASALGYYAAFLRFPDSEPSLIEMAQQELDAGRQECAQFDDSLSGRLGLESDPLFARVYIDDQLVGQTPTELIGLSPGEHIIRFELDGYEETIEVIELQSSQDQTFSATLATVPDDEEPLAVTAPPTVDDAEGFSPNPVAIGLAGGGVVLAATGMVLDLVVVPKYDQRRENLDRNSQEFADLTKTRLAYRNAFLGSYIAGGLLFASGAAWLAYDFFALSGDDPAKDASNYVLAPSVSPFGASLNLIGRF